MDLYLDSASLTDLDACLERGCVQGVTTNPSLLAKEPRADFVGHIRAIAARLALSGRPLPLSVEVFARTPEAMVTQGLELFEQVAYPHLNIKIPMGWDELSAVSGLARRGIAVNCTCLFTEAQAILAAGAGASFVSVFYCRLRDGGGDPAGVVSRIRATLDKAGSPARIIAGSIRAPSDAVEAHVAGAHIVTTGVKVLSQMSAHPQTTSSVNAFLKDFDAWIAAPATPPVSP